MLKAITYSKQTGIAVITAVLVLAIAVTAATTIAANYQLDMRRTENFIHSSQAWAYAKGGEQFAMSILARDVKDNSYDGLDEPWWNDDKATTFPVPGGVILGKIEDAQGKLNLNNLVEANKPNPEMKKRVSRLFFLLEINPSLVDAIIDWIDSDVNPAGPNGAEQDIYRGLENAYLPADQLMKDISELRLIHGFNQEMYNKLIRYVTVLPAQYSSLNLNTAPAVVLASLHEEIDLSLANQLVEERLDKPYKTITDFLRHPDLLSQGINIANPDGLNIRTNHFNLITIAEIGKSRVKMTSTIFRGTGNKLRIVKRSQDL